MYRSSAWILVVWFHCVTALRITRCPSDEPECRIVGVAVVAPSVHPSSVSPVVSKDNADAQLINVTDAVENMLTKALKVKKITEIDESFLHNATQPVNIVQKPKTDIAMEVAEEAQRLLPVGIETVHGVQADAQRVRLETIKALEEEGESSGCPGAPKDIMEEERRKSNLEFAKLKAEAMEALAQETENDLKQTQVHLEGDLKSLKEETKQEEMANKKNSID